MTSPVWHPFTQQQGWSEEEPLVIENGHAIIPATPGNGMRWKAEAVARYRIG